MYYLYVFFSTEHYHKTLDALAARKIKMKFDPYSGGMRYISEEYYSFRDSQKIRDSLPQELRNSVHVGS